MRWLVALLGSVFVSVFFVSCGFSGSGGYDAHVARQVSFSTDAGSMAFLDEGEGKTIVLLHGVPTSSWLYREVIPGLADKGYRVIAPDLIGYGSSAKPKNVGDVYSPAAQAKRVRGLLKDLKVQKYSVLMHDMGGLVAWEMLRQDEGEISNLICLNTIVREEGFESPNLEPGVLSRAITEAYSNKWTNKAIIGMTFKHMGLTRVKKLGSSDCEGYTRPLEGGSHEALYAFFTSLDEDLFSGLERNAGLFRRFKGRTMILWGERDEILTTAQIPFLREHLRVAEEDVHIFPDNSHFLPEEIPEEMIMLVSDFLEE